MAGMKQRVLVGESINSNINIINMIVITNIRWGRAWRREGRCATKGSGTGM